MGSNLDRLVKFLSYILMLYGGYIYIFRFRIRGELLLHDYGEDHKVIGLIVFLTGLAMWVMTKKSKM